MAVKAGIGVEYDGSLCLCSKHYDELEEEPDEDMRRRTMHLSSTDATPERLPSPAKQHRRSSGLVCLPISICLGLCLPFMKVLTMHT